MNRNYETNKRNIYSFMDFQHSLLSETEMRILILSVLYIKYKEGARTKLA